MRNAQVRQLKVSIRQQQQQKRKVSEETQNESAPGLHLSWHLVKMEFGRFS